MFVILLLNVMELLSGVGVVFYMLEVISSFRSLRTGLQVFALLMLFLNDVAYYVFGQEHAIAMHLAL